MHRAGLLLLLSHSAAITARMSSSTLPPSCSVEVHLVKMFTDNYCHVVIDRETRLAAVVDPGDPAPVIARVKEMEKEGILLTLKQLWATHKHSDHVGGNEALKAAFPELEIIGTQYEAVPSMSRGVGEGDTFNLGASSVTVMHVPCHTKGHVAFSVPGALFPGDTLFVGGCGRFFEGDGRDMLRNMDRFATLPPSTLVYPAHEYTESNLKFLASVDAELCAPVYDQVQATRRAGKPTIPTTIGAELCYNLFMKARDPRVQALLGVKGGGEDAAVETITKLREMKNRA